MAPNTPKKPADVSALYAAFKDAKKVGKGKAKLVPNNETVDLIKRWVNDLPDGSYVKVADIAEQLRGKFDGATILEALGYTLGKSRPSALARNTLQILENQGLLSAESRNKFVKVTKAPTA